MSNLVYDTNNPSKCLESIEPIYYKNLGLSNYYNFSSVYMGKDIDGYIRIPRGLRDLLINKCKESGIEYDISDQKEKGSKISGPDSGI